MAIIRKTVAIREQNKNYVDQLVEKSQKKSFSRALNNIIEERRKLDEGDNDSNSENSI